MSSPAIHISRTLKAWQFLTVLRLPDSLGARIDHDEDFSLAAPYFVAAGLLISLPVMAIWYFAYQLIPVQIAAAIVIFSTCLFTGALHEDGLADYADGFGGGSDRTRILEIMKDSHIGTYGVIAMIGTFGLRIFALASLGLEAGILAILLAMCLSRTAMLLPIRFSQYARPQGTGSLVSTGVKGLPFSIATLAATGMTLFVAGWIGLLLIIVLIMIISTMVASVERRVGGYTGDFLGAVQQISEVSIYVILAAVWTIQ